VGPIYHTEWRLPAAYSVIGRTEQPASQSLGPAVCHSQSQHSVYCSQESTESSVLNIIIIIIIICDCFAVVHPSVHPTFQKKLGGGKIPIF